MKKLEIGMLLADDAACYMSSTLILVSPSILTKIKSVVEEEYPYGLILPENIIHILLWMTVER